MEIGWENVVYYEGTKFLLNAFLWRFRVSFCLAIVRQRRLITMDPRCKNAACLALSARQCMETCRVYLSADTRPRCDSSNVHSLCSQHRPNHTRTYSLGCREISFFSRTVLRIHGTPVSRVPRWGPLLHQTVEKSIRLCPWIGCIHHHPKHLLRPHCLFPEFFQDREGFWCREALLIHHCSWHCTGKWVGWIII